MQMPRRVFEHDNRFVDQHTDDHGDAAKRHGVERFVCEIQSNERAETREWQSDQHDQCGPVAAQKNEDHRSGEQKSKGRFVHEIADRLAHINRLIHHDIEIDAFDALEDRLELRFDPFDYRDRVRTWLAVDRNVNLPFALHTHDVGLDLMRVLDLRDITDVSRRPVANPQRQIVQFRHRRHHTVGVDLIIEHTELGVAGRNHHVRIADRVDDIERRKAAGLRFEWIDIREDAAQPAAVNGRRDYAGDRLQAVAQVEIGNVVKFGFIKGRARHADETKRDRSGRIKRHHHRWNRPRRQIIEVAHCQRCDL